MSSNEEAEADHGLGEVDQQSIARVPVLLLLDTSWSMTNKTRDEDGNKRRKIDQLNDGLETFKQEIEEDFQTKHAVDVSVVTFGGDFEIEQEFDTLQNWTPPDLDATGTTPMCEAIGRGLQHLEKRKGAINDQNLQRKRALVWLLTDGKPDNTSGTEWDKAQSVIEDGTNDDAFFFYAVGIGDDADMDTLEELISAGDDDDVASFRLEEGAFKEFFEIVSASASMQSQGAGEGDTAEDIAQEPTD